MDNKEPMSPEKKTKVAYICAGLTVLFVLFVGVSAATYSDKILPLVLGIGALIYGPICFIAYLVEIKRGIFKMGDEDSEK